MDGLKIHCKSFGGNTTQISCRFILNRSFPPNGPLGYATIQLSGMEKVKATQIQHHNNNFDWINSHLLSWGRELKYSLSGIKETDDMQKEVLTGSIAIICCVCLPPLSTFKKSSNRNTRLWMKPDSNKFRWNNNVRVVLICW